MAQAHTRPFVDAYAEAGSAARLAKAPKGRAAAAGRKAVVTAVDSKRGVPSFLWAAKGSPDAYAPGATAEQAARTYLERYAPLYGVSRADVATSQVSAVHDTGRGGIVVTAKQRVGDVEVFRSEVKLLLGRDKRLLAISGSPHAAASPKRGAGFRLGREQALALALGDMYGYSLDAGAFHDTGRAQGAYRYYDVTPSSAGLRGVSMRASPRIKQVYFPMPDRLVPAYYLELETSGGGGSYAYVVSADDGRVLYRADLVAYDAFTYKVFADDDAARHYPPADNPYVDATPHPTGAPNGYFPAFDAQKLITIEGFNSPAGAPGPDPWLPADATVTQGNNVKAYADHDEVPAAGGAPGPLDGQTGSDPTAGTTAPKTFAYTFDPEGEPDESADQVKSAITQLFYTTNWLHDYWYDSGFDEASGVAQNSNFGRVKDEAGNVIADGENDAMEAQAQDKYYAGNRDNANMSTPADGGKPRMQMFAWTNRDTVFSVATSVPGLNITEIGRAAFGPKDFDVTAALAYVNDNVLGPPTAPGGPTGTVNDGCEAYAGLAGKIAVVDRGYCGFALKAYNAQQAGASGIIIVNNSPAAPGTMAFAATPAPITIGAVLIRQADGAAIKTALGGGAVTGTLKRDGNVDYDGTHDNVIIAHEWGHYWHHRLVLCGSDPCRAMSEGWGDVQSVMLMVKDGDDTSGAFPGAAFAGVAGPEFSYFGIRRYPYSTDRAKNPLTFKHIANKNALPPETVAPVNPSGPPPAVVPNAEVHNAGEVWTVTLFDAYAKLLAAHPFDEAKRRMADYLVGGMKLTPVEPTFTQQRDAILAYTFSQDRADFDALAAAFAGRGLGVGAVSPPVAGGETDANDDQTFNEAEENFDVKGDLALVALELDDGRQSCDGDGIVDAEETGRLTATIGNVGMADLANSTVTITSDSPSVEFPAGNTAQVVELDPYGRAKVQIELKLKADAAARAPVVFTVAVSNAASYHAEVSGAVDRTTNLDEVPNTSAVDDVETQKTAWAAANALDEEVAIWARDRDETTKNRHWHGDNAGFLSDGTLESPDVVVGTGGDFTLKFKHAYGFEFDEKGKINFDGGVIEYKEAGGEWADVATLGVATGYGGTIYDEPKAEPPDDNPLAGRQGFVGKSANYPALQPVTLNFTNKLAGKTVRFRFRIGTDGGVSAEGWDIDDIEVAGASSPFFSVADDASSCAGAPLANAGADQTVRPGATVTLDGSGSTDPDTPALTYEWSQLDGPSVTLTSAAGQKPTFTAPNEATRLTFNLKVTDGKGLSNDAITVTVEPDTGTGGSGGAAGAAGSGTGGSGGSNPGNSGRAGSITIPGDSDDDGCGCSTVGSSPARGALLPALAAGLALVRRRRRAPKGKGALAAASLAREGPRPRGGGPALGGGAR